MTTRFSAPARVLHWGMAVLIIGMLFLGVFMASTIGPLYAGAVALHRPVGIALLVLVVLRLINRVVAPHPSLPDTLPRMVRVVAGASHGVLYALMLAMPLVGWAMLSAGGYPVRMWAGFDLPPILSHDPTMFAILRQTHTVLALVLFATILLHIAAALLHALVLRDGVFSSMKP